MNAKNIQFLRMTHLRGPNIWTYRPVMDALLDLGALEDFPMSLAQVVDLVDEFDLPVSTLPPRVVMLW